MSKFKAINTKDQDLNRVQQNIEAALNGIDSFTSITVAYAGSQQVITKNSPVSPFVNGSLVTIPLTLSQDNLIPHSLGRVPIAWFIGGVNAGSMVWEIASTQLQDSSGQSLSRNSKYLNLRCSANCTISVWVV